MGWDAYACRSVQDHLFNLDNYDPEPLLDTEMRRVFEEASAELKRQTGRGGANLCTGELSGAWSKRCLSLATPISCSTEEDERGVLCWSPEIVQRANALADWSYTVEEIEDEKIDKDDTLFLGLLTCIKDDARVFLQTCAEHGYAISFSG
jgi:hypothetical protein